MTPALLHRLILAVADDVIAHADELTELDQAVGDGDHGINMKRGFEAVRAEAGSTAKKPLPEALKAIGTQLVMKVGGASGPLYGTLFLALSKEIAPDASNLPAAFAKAVEAVKARGKSHPGQKTMLDVLTPVQMALAEGGGTCPARLPGRRGQRGGRHNPDAGHARPRLVPRRALDRAHGPRRPLVGLDRRVLMPGIGGLKRCRMSGSSSCRTRPRSPRAPQTWCVKWWVTASNLAYTGGDPGGGLGTGVASIQDAIDRAWSEAGVAILVDLGGAETNSEMAVEMLDARPARPGGGLQRADRRRRRDGGDRSFRRFAA